MVDDCVMSEVEEVACLSIENFRATESQMAKILSVCPTLWTESLPKPIFPKVSPETWLVQPHQNLLLLHFSYLLDWILCSRLCSYDQ